MNIRTSVSSIRLVATVAAASGLFVSAHAQVFPVTLFTDNFLTNLEAPGDTSDLNTNIGAAGGRQGGDIVSNINPAGFGYDVFGKVGFTTGNGWDLRSQSNWPAAGPVNQYTLRFRDNEAGQWSSVSPQIGFNSFIQDDTYRIQVQIVHAHLDPGGIGDRWAGITFGAQPEVRFPAFGGNGGVIVTPGGAVTIFADGSPIGSGNVSVPANGAFELDLRIVDNMGEVYINNSLIAGDLNFSTIVPAVISLSALAGTNADVFTSTQIRFDNFAVSTIPEPSTYALFGGLLALGLAGWHRRNVRS